MYPHFQDPLKSLYIRDHRAVAQCDTSLKGSDIKLLLLQSFVFPNRFHPADLVFPTLAEVLRFSVLSLCGKTQQINLYLTQLLNLLVPPSLKRGYERCIGFLFSYEGLKNHKPLWFFTLIINLHTFLLILYQSNAALCLALLYKLADRYCPLK